MRKLTLALLLLVLLCPLWSFSRIITKKFLGAHLLINSSGYRLVQGKQKKGLLLAYNTPLKINGIYNDTIVALKNGLVISGEVRKNIFTVRTNVRVKRSAAVYGYIVSLGGRVIVEKGAEAKVINLLLFVNKLRFSLGFKIFLIYLSFVTLGIFFNFFFLNNFIFLGEYIKKRFFSALFFGLLALPLLFLLTLALAGTLVGIFFLPALLFIYVFYFFFGFFTSATVLGEKLVKLVTSRDHPYFEQFIGITLCFFGAVIPWFGALFLLLLICSGLGAALRLKFGVR